MNRSTEKLSTQIYLAKVATTRENTILALTKAKKMAYAMQCWEVNEVLRKALLGKGARYSDAKLKMFAEEADQTLNRNK